MGARDTLSHLLDLRQKFVNIDIRTNKLRLECSILYCATTMPSENWCRTPILNFLKFQELESIVFNVLLNVWGQILTDSMA